MSIPGITGTGTTGSSISSSSSSTSTGTSGAARVSPSSADTTATAAAHAPAGAARTAAATAAPNEVKQEEADDKPTSVHFPWLSRLSAELEAASKQRARFPTQIMGDHLDRKA